MSQNFLGVKSFDFSMRSTSFKIFWMENNKKWPTEIPTSRSRAETFRIPPVKNNDSNVTGAFQIQMCEMIEHAIGRGTKYVKINWDHIETYQSLQCICMAMGSVFCRSFLSLSYLRPALLHGSWVSAFFHQLEDIFQQIWSFNKAWLLKTSLWIIIMQDFGTFWHV